jgi:hypothetical protein
MAAHFFGRRRVLLLGSAMLLRSSLVARGEAVVSLSNSRPSDRRRVPLMSRSFGTTMTLRGGGETTKNDGFELLTDRVVYDNWRRLIVRRVRLPSGKEADFEIVAQRGTDRAVAIFVWDSASKAATLIREYMPCTHSKMIGCATGMIEGDKHDEDSLTAARHELEEECHLTGGRWIRLTEKPVVMDKYSTTALTPYLVIDPVPVPQKDAKPRDTTEEGMEVRPGVPVQEVRNMLLSGQMMIVGSWTSLLALDKLQELQEID